MDTECIAVVGHTWAVGRGIGMWEGREGQGEPGIPLAWCISLELAH